MEKNDNLRKQQKLTNQLNNLLEISANSLLCGPSCQREKNLKTLQIRNCQKMNFIIQ